MPEELQTETEEYPIEEADEVKGNFVTRSKAFQRARDKAEEYAQDPEKTQKLLKTAVKKSKRRKLNKGRFANTRRYLTAFFRLIRAYFRRQYTAIPWQSLVLSIAAVIYFVSPIDVLPDLIPIAGILDDATVIGFVIAAIRSDMEKFLRWEAAHDVAEQPPAELEAEDFELPDSEPQLDHSLKS